MDVRDGLVYLAERYPHQHELSLSRLMTMMYLADWKSAIEHDEQATGVRWVLGNYGPYAEDVYDAMREDPKTFTVIQEQNVHGTSKNRVKLNEGAERSELSERDRDLLEFVTATAAPLRWTEFMALVNSTYPVMTASDQFEGLDLVKAARAYADARESLQAH